MITLMKGLGSMKSRSACWMTMLNYCLRIGEKDFHWTDKVACVDPTINSLAITINDWLSDEKRTHVIWPHRFAPVGTAMGPEMEKARVFLLLDRSIRRWAPQILDLLETKAGSESLRLLSPVVDLTTAKAAADKLTRSLDIALANKVASSLSLTLHIAQALTRALESARALVNASALDITLANKIASALANASVLANVLAIALANKVAGTLPSASALDLAVVTDLIVALNLPRAATLEPSYTPSDFAEKELLPLLLEMCAMGRIEHPMAATPDDLERDFAGAAVSGEQPWPLN